MIKSRLSILSVIMCSFSASAYAADLTMKVTPQGACYFGDWDLMLSELAADNAANVRSSLVMTIEQGKQVASFKLLESNSGEATLSQDIPISLGSNTAPIRISICKDSSQRQSCKGKRSDSFEQMASRYIFTEKELFLPQREFEALRDARRKLPSPEDRIYFFSVLATSPQERTAQETKLEGQLGNIKAEREGSVVRIKLPYLDRSKCG